MNKSTKLGYEFWDHTQKKWDFWSELEDSLNEMKSLFHEKKANDYALSLLQDFSSIFRILEDSNFKKSNSGRDQALSIIVNFLKDQISEKKSFF